MLKISHDNKKKQVIIFLVIWMILFISAEVLIYLQLRNYGENERSSQTLDYVLAQELFAGVINEYTSLLKGVGAYIQMNDNLDDDEINQLLSILIGDREEEFINVGILKDTTITWVYPLEGNESAIGVDLSQVQGQADQIAYVKTTLNQVLVGPIDLVQGGTGFIIRIPIVKNNNYWGMTSFVLKTQVVNDAFRGFEDKHKVQLLVRHSQGDQKIIYGNPDLIDMDPLVYKSDREIQPWEMFLVPDGGWIKTDSYFLILSLIDLFVTAYIASRFFKFIIRINKLEEKNLDMVKKSTRDAFTGIYNRGYFDLKAQEEIQYSDRYRSPLTMIYFDIDHFKSINDTFGHAKGDVVLLEVTRMVQKLLRTNDFFARWGGDEFVILLPNTDMSGAETVGQKIESGIRQLNLGPEISLTASIGIAERVIHEFYDSWFARVDRALYDAKENGKNQIVLSDHTLEDYAKLKIVWQRQWDCGEHLIDNQHKTMVSLSNDLVQSSFHSSNYDETIRKANKLLDNVFKHFEDEINYLEAIGYPKVKDHIRLHQKLIEDLKLKYQGLVDKTLESGDLLSYLQEDLIYNHFVRTDEDYRLYLMKQEG